MRQKVVLEQSVPRRPPATLRRTHMVRAKKNKKMTAVATPTDLKRLAFVESAAVSSYEYLTGSAYFAKACGYYSNAKETNALKVRRPPRRVEQRVRRAATRDPAVGTADHVQDRDSFRRFAHAPNPDTLRGAPRVAAPAGRITRIFRPRASECSLTFFIPSVRRPQGSITKIEDLIKAYGMPVVAKVQEKYPEYMTNVDGKVDVVVTKAVDIWTSKIAPSAPVAMAKSALAAYPVKVEELLAQREEYFKKIEAFLADLKAKAVALPAEVSAAITKAIAEARAKIDDAQLFEKVKTAYETALKYPAVVAVLEKTAPVAAKAVEVAGPYYVKAKDIATPYVAKATEVAGPYVTMVTDRFKKVPELN